MARRRSITRAADWDRLRRTGIPGRCDGVRLRVLPSSTGGRGRLGMRVRVSGPARAVTRNRVRRRVREAWRMLPETVGVDAVVYADDSLATKEFQMVRSALSRALARALEQAGPS